MSTTSLRRWSWLVLILGFVVNSTPLLQGGSLSIEEVFGPETKTGPYKHPARFTQLSNGDFYMVYYGGEGEYAVDTGVFGSRLPAGSEAWFKPVAIARDPFRSLGNAVIWEAPDGVVWLFYVARYDDTWSSSRVQAKVSHDQAHTWSDAFPLVAEEGMMVCNRPIVLHDGDYLLPLYHETGYDIERTAPDSMGLFLRYDLANKTWQQTGRIRSANGNIQPVPVELAPGHLMAYCRRGGDFLPTTNGFLIRAESHDDGWTWSEGVNCEFLNPNSSVDFIRLRNGHLLLVYNDSMNERAPLTVAISTDNDQTYPYRRNVVEGPGDFAYPMAVEAQDGKIHVIYTSEERTVINHAIFDEAWVMNK